MIEKRTFDYIIEAIENNDEQAIVKLIDNYMPMINNCSKDEMTGEINEDLRSIIIAKLYEKIPSFKIIV